MKRSAELAPLSRDHHQALEVALGLRRVTDGTLEDAVGHFLAFWNRQGEHHFVIEERLVLPALSDDDARWAEASRRVRDEHRGSGPAPQLCLTLRQSRPRAGWVSCSVRTCGTRSGGFPVGRGGSFPRGSGGIGSCS
jgi:hypothetical protein